MIFILTDINYNKDILGLFLAIFIAILLASIIISLNFFFSTKNFYTFSDKFKIFAYECGFNAFQDARNFFDIRFYIIGLLFIIFDLEIFYLFPWVSIFSTLNFQSFISMFIFLLILTYGFIYEWQKGALEWE
jgi:NADH-quinone oxidoreductase subunit A